MHRALRSGEANLWSNVFENSVSAMSPITEYTSTELSVEILEILVKFPVFITVLIALSIVSINSVIC